jgi:capsular polysaccharide biosynthesis protein
MALAPITPRDRLQRLVDLVRKTLGYWWLIGAFALVGGALSLTFALTRPRRFESSAVLFYQERIQSSILSNREEVVQRNLGDRFRELLLARTQLAQIVGDPKLDPYPGMDPELAVDKLRQAVKFDSRGGNNFRITYADSEPERAQAITAKLTKMLQDKDEALRNDSAQATVNFITKQKEEAAAELNKRTQALAQFLTKHPEFAQDSTTTNTEGAGIIAAKNAASKAQSGNPRLTALERQRERIQARLEASPDAPPIRIPVPPSPERAAAEAAVSEAQRELNGAQRELDDALAKYTDKHPTVISAQQRVSAAQERLRHAQAAVPPDVETTIAPATPADRTKLQKELAQIESQIADVEHAASKGSGAAPATTTNWIVDLETQHAELRRQQNEQRERVGALADSVFRAQLDASQKIAEQGGRLSIVDPAFKPMRPSGPGKTIFLLAGMVVFLGLGSALALGLSIIDDRLYRREDLDIVGVPVLAVIPPMMLVSKRRKHS